jgi:hypothetical protein
MSRLPKSRLRAVIGAAFLGAAAVLVAVLAFPASHAGGSARVPSHTVTIPCKPANELTPQQRAALLASMPGGKEFRKCTPGTSTKVRLAAFYEFTGKRSWVLSNVQLSDKACDGRTVYADVTTNNGWNSEFVNSAGCGTTGYWAGPIPMSDPSGYTTKYVYIRLYACNTWGCSSVVSSSYHHNPYSTSSGTIYSHFSFCNGTGGSTIACFYADLD